MSSINHNYIKTLYKIVLKLSMPNLILLCIIFNLLINSQKKNETIFLYICTNLTKDYNFNNENKFEWIY